MSDNSAIEWTDATWNPVRGCSIVSEGCRNCYAMRVAHRFPKVYPGLTKLTPSGPTWTGKVMMVADKLFEPLRWLKPRRIFVNSMADLFHKDVPDDFIDQVFAVMAINYLHAERPTHTFQILTKRPERMRDYLVTITADRLARAGAPMMEDSDRWWDSLYQARKQMHVQDWFPNVWAGVSIEDQETADERISYLLETPAAVRWISAEPLIEPAAIGLMGTVPRDLGVGYRPVSDLIHWVVAGGESGPGARPLHPEWVRIMRDECQVSNVPFLFKQWGEWRPYISKELGKYESLTESKELPRDGAAMFAWGDGYSAAKVGKKDAGRELDGRTWDEYPEAI